MQREAQRIDAPGGRWHAARQAIIAAALAAAAATILVGLFGPPFLGVPLAAAAALLAGVWKFVDERGKAQRQRKPERPGRSAGR